jgi:hypothetical protein
VGVGDNAYLWVKPFDFLTIGAGGFSGAADFGIRGKIGNFGGFAQAVHATADEDAIFTRFKSSNGGIIALTPIDGLTIGVVFNNSVNGENFSSKGPGSYGTQPFDDSFKLLQIGAGYQIGTIGLVRAQFIGGTNSHKWPAGTPEDPEWTLESAKWWGRYNRIEAAFALTAIDGLTLDIGGKIPLAYKETIGTSIPVSQNVNLNGQEATFQAPFQVSAGVNFAAGDLSIGGRVDTTLLGSAKLTYGTTDIKYSEGIVLDALVEPAFDLGAFVVGGDIGFKFTGDSKITATGYDDITLDGGIAFDLGAWVGLNFSNGLFRAGVASHLPVDKKALVFSIPLVLEYFF